MRFFEAVVGRDFRGAVL